MTEKVLALEDKWLSKVKITNFMIERFHRDEAFAKLRQAIGLGAADKYKIFKLTELLTSSTEARAFNKLKDDLIKTMTEIMQIAKEKILKENIEEKEKGKKIAELEQENSPSYAHPKVREIMELESGLELEKLVLQTSKLPGDFTPEDMMITSWLVDYKDDKKS